MKLTFSEHSSCFELHIEAETMADAVQLARFGIDKTKEIHSQSVWFRPDGTAAASLLVGKKRNPKAAL